MSILSHRKREGRQIPTVKFKGTSFGFYVKSDEEEEDESLHITQNVALTNIYSGIWIERQRHRKQISNYKVANILINCIKEAITAYVKTCGVIVDKGNDFTCCKLFAHHFKK